MWMLLHGFSGSPRSWDEVLVEAELDADPVRPALAGHQPSEAAVSVSSFEGELSRLASIAQVSERPRLLCGYSMGARLALGLLVQRPELFDAAVLLGVHPGLRDEPERQARRALDAARARQLRSEGLEAFMLDWEALPLFESQRELPESVIHEQREIRLAHDAEGLARAFELLGLAEMPDYGAEAASVEVPVTLMAGSRDTKFCALAEELESGLPRAELQVVDGVGHNVLLEAPEAVAATMKRVERAAKGVGRA